MKSETLHKMRLDTTLSDIDRMAAGCLIKTKKHNGHRNLPFAAEQLQVIYPELTFTDATEYVSDIAQECDDREW